MYIGSKQANCQQLFLSRVLLKGGEGQRQSMIISEKEALTLHKSFDKIITIYPSINHTFVFLACRNFNKEVLVHCNRNGKILHELPFDDPTSSFSLNNQTEAIVLQTRKNSILLVDLISYKTISIPFLFLSELTDLSRLESFNISKMCCVRQTGAVGNNRLKLTYFGIPLQEESKPLEVFASEEGEWTNDNKIRKGNEESMMVWFKENHKAGISVNIYELYTSEGILKGQHRLIQASMEGFCLQTKMQISLTTCWQMKRNHLLLSSVLSTRDSNYLEEGTRLWMVLDTISLQLRQLQFKFPLETAEYQISAFGMGICSVIPTFCFEGGRSVSSPIYYINNLKEELIEVGEWECDSSFRWIVSPLERDVFYQCQFSNGEIHQVTITRRQLMTCRIVAVHMLRQVCEEIDYNLLKQTVQLLPLYGQELE